MMLMIALLLCGCSKQQYNWDDIYTKVNNFDQKITAYEKDIFHLNIIDKKIVNEITKGKSFHNSQKMKYTIDLQKSKDTYIDIEWVIEDGKNATQVFQIYISKDLDNHSLSIQNDSYILENILYFYNENMDETKQIIEASFKELNDIYKNNSLTNEEVHLYSENCYEVLYEVSENKEKMRVVHWDE